MFLSRSTPDQDFAADRRRYPTRAFLREQSIWAVWIYRFGRRHRRRGARRPFRALTSLFYVASSRVAETLTGISLPLECEIGPGLRIWHFGGIFVHPGVVIGPNCTLRQGVTIGNKSEGGAVPRLGRDVEVGAYAQIIGDIAIGDRVAIGAGAVVLKDVPSDSIAVGNPARILPRDPARR